MSRSMHRWPEPFSSEVAHRVERSFTLDDAWVFLNHGSFGATLAAVGRRQRALRDELERQPVHFFMRRCLGLLDESRERLARFVGASAADLVFVPNATTGVNTVLRSLEFGPSDVILTTNHDYGACRRALEFVARRSGATLEVAQLPFPLQSPERALDAVAAAIRPRTKLVLLDHVTSSTGLVMPIADLVGMCRQRGVLTLVDGAHAPGMLPVNLEALSPTFYTANCHKWLCAPKGSGFLYVAPEYRDRVVPLSISHGVSQRLVGRSAFHQEFDWSGTRDPTAELCVGTAIDTLSALLPGGMSELYERNRQMALAARDRLCAASGSEPLAPDEMIGSMATVAIDDRGSDTPGYAPGDPLYRHLIANKIEVPIFHWPESPRRFLRISAQVYNDAEQYEKLARAVSEALA